MTIDKNARAAILVACSLVASDGCFAQTTDQFYKGKTIDLVIGYPPGGSNDVYARAVSRHLARFLAGAPTIVPRNMPGGGSLLAGNYMYSAAPKDGSVLAMISPTAPLDEKLGNQAVKFKAGEFNWLGRMSGSVNQLMVWHNQPITSWKDALTKEVKLAATGAGSTVSVYPTVLNNVLKTKFKLVMGYKGSGEAMLAMERGEADGHSTSWEALKSQHPQWLRDNTVKILVQFALKRHPEMASVPTAIELAETEEQRAILYAVMAATEVGKPIFTAPGVPAERVTMLRRAFDQMVKDPEFAAEFTKQGLDLEPMSGEALQKLVEDVANIPPALVEKVKANYGG
jgi:tripartite-type tricarboxylate transporter receptor subunit TctC